MSGGFRIRFLTKFDSQPPASCERITSENVLNPLKTPNMLAPKRPKTQTNPSK
ncbi:unnamed protein product, partial [Nesidiocoris tenuis]